MTRETLFHPGAEFDGETLAGLDLGGVRAADVSLVDCVLRAPRFDDVRLEGLRLIDSTVTDAAGSVLRAGESVWRDAAWTGGRVGVVDAPDATLMRVEFADGKLDLLNLSSARLSTVTLTRMTIGELVLAEASGLDVVLVDCTVGVLDLHRARVKNLDVSESRLTDEVRGLNGLGGVVLSLEQTQDLAVALAQHLGARVRD